MRHPLGTYLLIGLCFFQAALVPEAMHHRSHGHHGVSDRPRDRLLRASASGAAASHDPHHCAVCQAITAFQFCWVGADDAVSSPPVAAGAPTSLSATHLAAPGLSACSPRAPPHL
jgi:hypothetical protein